MESNAKKLNLTNQEFVLLCDFQSSRRCDITDIVFKSSFLEDLAHKNHFSRLGFKWNVDMPVLLEKLKAKSETEMHHLVADLESFLKIEEVDYAYNYFYSPEIVLNNITEFEMGRRHPNSILNPDEFSLFCEIEKDVRRDGTCNYFKIYLLDDYIDAIKKNKLIKKGDANPYDLLKKLNNMRHEELLHLINDVDVFLNRDKEFYKGWACANDFKSPATILKEIKRN